MLIFVMYLARSHKSIADISKPFWKDSRHLAGQFSYLTDSAPLTKIVDENFETQFGSLLFCTFIITFFVIYSRSSSGVLTRSDQDR